jgi:hypothetical protein
MALPLSSLAGSIEAADASTFVRVEEVRDARPFVMGIFGRKFWSEPPDYPRHFVAFYAAGEGKFTAMGYIHYSAYEDSWLCGGLVIDERVYKRLPPSHRAAIRESGGIAQILLRATLDGLREAPAIWGYVGDRKSEVVLLRNGFVKTSDEKNMVVWNRELSQTEKDARLARIVALGPY